MMEPQESNPQAEVGSDREYSMEELLALRASLTEDERAGFEPPEFIRKSLILGLQWAVYVQWQDRPVLTILGVAGLAYAVIKTSIRLIIGS